MKTDPNFLTGTKLSSSNPSEGKDWVKISRRCASSISVGEMNIRYCLRKSSDEFDKRREHSKKIYAALRQHALCILSKTHTKTAYANSGNVNFDHGIKCFSAVMSGKVDGTNNPPSGAYPEQRACSKV